MEPSHIEIQDDKIEFENFKEPIMEKEVAEDDQDKLENLPKENKKIKSMAMTTEENLFNSFVLMN